jgi:hypothetical protein
MSELEWTTIITSTMLMKENPTTSYGLDEKRTQPLVMVFWDEENAKRR